LSGKFNFPIDVIQISSGTSFAALIDFRWKELGIMSAARQDAPSVALSKRTAPMHGVIRWESLKESSFIIPDRR
jgi:hypothetical protein